GDGSAAVRFFRGLNTKEGLRFEPGIPLFSAKNGKKEFPGSWINVCVTDWNNDGINDLLIGTSVATLDGKFNHELSWTWEHETGIAKKDPAYFSPVRKKAIEQEIMHAEERQATLGLSDEEMRKQKRWTKEDYLKHYYGKGKEAYKTLAHKGYVYVMLGEKRNKL
ncbi:hypothetical protein JYT50_00875, partial [bacterium AH-315-A23]|nr:hypothetical protein [bacterium AH-315-A23]